MLNASQYVFIMFFCFADVKAKPLGCMNDALSSASASFEVLQRQLSDCVTAVDMLQKTIKPSRSVASSMSSASVTTLVVSTHPHVPNPRRFEFEYHVCFFCSIFR